MGVLLDGLEVLQGGAGERVVGILLVLRDLLDGPHTVPLLDLIEFLEALGQGLLAGDSGRGDSRGGRLRCGLWCGGLPLPPAEEPERRG